MAIIKPFFAVRPIKSLASKIASRPYDVVNLTEVKAHNPNSFLRITRSECEFANNTNPYSEIVYEKAIHNFDLFKKNKWLFQNTEESLFIYQITDGHHIQTGISGLFSCLEYKTCLIKKHENTRTDKEIDRTNHIKFTCVQMGQVYLTSNSPNLCNDVIQKSCENENLLYNFFDDENIKHKIWKIPKILVEEVIAEISQLESLYIVDGHHRVAAAYNNNCEFFIATLFPSNQLSTGCCNRILKDIYPYTNENFIDQISEYFFIKQSKDFSPGQISMYLEKRWQTLLLKENLSKFTLGSISSYILQSYILERILGIDNPRTSKKIDYIRNTKGRKVLEDKVRNSHGAVAFCLTPPKVEDVIAIANEGEVMPPKSTWFWPKLKDGLLIYEY